MICYGINMVARDGIEPPTPAFSGLYSSVGKSFIPRNMSMLSRLHTIEFNGTNWNQHQFTSVESPVRLSTTLRWESGTNC